MEKHISETKAEIADKEIQIRADLTTRTGVLDVEVEKIKEKNEAIGENVNNIGSSSDEGFRDRVDNMDTQIKDIMNKVETEIKDELNNAKTISTGIKEDIENTVKGLVP